MFPNYAILTTVALWSVVSQATGVWNATEFDPATNQSDTLEIKETGNNSLLNVLSAIVVWDTTEMFQDKNPTDIAGIEEIVNTTLSNMEDYEECTNTTCKNGGECSVLCNAVDCYTECECRSSFTGRFCEIGVPSNVTSIVFYKVTSTSITFQLTGPNDTEVPAFTHYIMRYQIMDDPDSEKLVEWEKGTPYVLHNLIPNSTYLFGVSARNYVGEGPRKTAKYTMPEESVPEPPLLTLRETLSHYPDRFIVRWEAPHDNGAPIVEYLIRYFKVKKLLGNWTQREKAVQRSVSADQRSFPLTGLVGNSYYRIEIRAGNMLGISLPAVKIFKTRADPCFNHCFHEGGCKEHENGNLWCDCNFPFSGERCEHGDDSIKLSFGMILIWVASVCLVIIALIAVCLLWCCIRERKAS